MREKRSFSTCFNVVSAPATGGAKMHLRIQNFVQRMVFVAAIVFLGVMASVSYIKSADAAYSCSKCYSSCKGDYIKYTGTQTNTTGTISGGGTSSCPGCRACATNYSPNGDNTACTAACTTCAAGTYWNGSSCTTCPATSSSSGTAVYCTGFTCVTSPSTGQGKNNCPSPYINSNAAGNATINGCHAWISCGKTITTAGGSVVSCPTGKYCPTSGANYGSLPGNVYDCPSGYREGSGICAENSTTANEKCWGNFTCTNPTSGCASGYSCTYTSAAYTKYANGSVRTGSATCAKATECRSAVNSSSNSCGSVSGQHCTDGYGTTTRNATCPTSHPHGTPSWNTYTASCASCYSNAKACTINPSCPAGHTCTYSGTYVENLDGSIRSGSKTCIANPTPIIYTITLDKQSGSGGTSTIYEKYGVNFSLTSGGSATTTITVPTRTGYVFGGYYSSSGCSGTQRITAGGTISASNTTFTSNTTIYACWSGCQSGYYYSSGTCKLCSGETFQKDCSYSSKKQTCNYTGGGGGTSGISSCTGSSGCTPSCPSCPSSGCTSGESRTEYDYDTQTDKGTCERTRSRSRTCTKACNRNDSTCDYGTLASSESCGSYGSYGSYGSWSGSCSANSSGYTGTCGSCTLACSTSKSFSCSSYFTGYSGSGTYNECDHSTPNTTDANNYCYQTRTCSGQASCASHHTCTWDTSKTYTVYYGDSTPVCPKLTEVPNVYTITLNNQSATSGGTGTVYQKYGTGFSLSNFGTTTTSITVPYKNGYTFGGYYTSTNCSGTQRITASGSISASNTTFTSNTTLYACWEDCGVGYYCNGGTKTPCSNSKPSFASYNDPNATSSTCPWSGTVECGYSYSGGTSGTKAACGSGKYRTGASTITQSSNSALACSTPNTGFYANGTTACSATACSGKPSGAAWTGSGGSSNSCPWSQTCAENTYWTGTACAACSGTTPISQEYTATGTAPNTSSPANNNCVSSCTDYSDTCANSGATGYTGTAYYSCTTGWDRSGCKKSCPATTTPNGTTNHTTSYDKTYPADCDACSIISCTAGYKANSGTTNCAAGCTECAVGEICDGDPDPKDCPAGYRDGPAVTTQAQCRKNCTDYSVSNGTMVADNAYVVYGTSGNSCTFTLVCNTDYHEEAGECVSDTKTEICTIPNGTGTKECTWNGTAWDCPAECDPTGCNVGYHLYNNECTSNTQACDSTEVNLPGSTGNATYSGGAWDKSNCEKEVQCTPDGGGNGKKTCKYTSGSGATAVFNTSCTTCEATDCPEGTWLNGTICDICPAGQTPNADQTACEECPEGSYCPGDCDPISDPDCKPAYACPNNGKSPAGSDDITDCYQNCPAWADALPNGCSAINNHQTTVFYSVSLVGYELCTYDAVFKNGYYASGNNTTAPSCPVWNYTILYNANGGTGGQTPTEYTVETPTITLGSPTRANSVFKGWFTESDFSDSAVATIALGSTGDRVFYAKWTCDAGYYADSATSCAPVDDDHFSGEDDEFQYTCPDGTTAAGTNKDDITDCHKTVSYTSEACATGTQTATISSITDAEWTATGMTKNLTSGTVNYTYSNQVCLTCNAGYWLSSPTCEACPGGGNSPAGNSSDAKICFQACPDKAKPANCASISKDQETVNYSAADGISGSYAVCTYTVVENPGYTPSSGENPTCNLGDPYTITYNMNGGTGGNSPTNYTVETPTITLGTPVRDNSVFKGWFTEADFSDSIVLTIPLGSTGNKEFFAKWSCEAGYYADSATSCAPVGPGHFSGEDDEYRYACPDGTTSIVSTGNSIGVCSKVVPYSSTSCETGTQTATIASITDAVWTATGMTKNLTSGTVNYVHSNQVCLTCNAGYWLSSPTCEACPAGLNQTSTQGNSGDATACFADCPAGSLPENCASISNDQATVPYSDASGTGGDYLGCTYTVIPDPSYDAVDNGTDAPYCEPTGYTITYHLNGGSGGNNPTSYNLTTPTFQLGTPTRENSKFIGWYLSSDFTTGYTTEVLNGSSGDLVFYAAWTCNAGYYADTPTSCAQVGQGYYSGSDDNQRYICPDGFSTISPVSSIILSCYKDEDITAIDSDCSAGVKRTYVDFETVAPTVCVNNTCTYATQPETIVGVYYEQSPLHAAKPGYYVFIDVNDGVFECRPAGIGYYSPAGDDSRTQCFPGYSTLTETESAITACYKDEDANDLDSDCDSGVRRSNIPAAAEYLTPYECDMAAGSPAYNTCVANSTPAFTPNYSAMVPFTADAGYYVVEWACPEVGDGYYSPAMTAPRTACPTGFSGSDLPRAEIEDCYKSCTVPASVPHAIDVSVINAKEYYNGTEYPACQYDITCEAGYTGNQTPECEANSFTLDFNGSSPTSGSTASKTCEYGQDCILPANGFNKTGFVFTGWSKTGPDGSTDYSDKQNVKNAYTDGTHTLFAKWGRCAVGYYWDGSTCDVCPIGMICGKETCIDPADDCGECPSGNCDSCTLTGTNCPPSNCTPLVDDNCPSICPITDPACGTYICPPGTTTATTGSTELSQCIVDCETLTGNTGVLEWDQATLKDLLEGKYCIVKECDAGKIPNADKTACEDCPAGTYKPAEFSDLTQCLPCPANAICEPGTEEPVCNDGFTLVGTGTEPRICKNTYESCTVGEVGVGVKGGQYGEECVLTECLGDNHISVDGKTCEPNKKECKTEHGSGYQQWNGTGYGECVENACDSGYKMTGTPGLGGKCEPCGTLHVLSYAADGQCIVQACEAGFHIEGNGKICVEDKKACEVPNSSESYRSWNSETQAFGECTAYACNDGFHLSSNACVKNAQACTLPNGTGVQEWIGDDVNGEWSDCHATACKPGYTDDPTLTNDRMNACGECNNRYGTDGEFAVASYVAGCEISRCMYQGEKYSLVNNECVPICPLTQQKDETGSVRWNPATEKCEISCEAGYTVW